MQGWRDGPLREQMTRSLGTLPLTHSKDIQRPGQMDLRWRLP
jgi:hypothetical protein